jgi:NADH-quinone oxidoreductase subunit L
MTSTEILVWLALIFPFLGTALVPLVAKAGLKVKVYLAVLFGFCTAAVVLIILDLVWLGGPPGLAYSFSWAPSLATTATSTGLAFTVYIDTLAAMMAAIAGGIGALVLLYSVKYMEGNDGLTRYYALVLLFIGSMIGLVFTDNLLVLYFFWEAVGLCSYALIGFYTKDPKAARAGIKALVTTRVGDIGLLIGIFVLAAGVTTSLGADFFSQALSIQYLIAHASAIPATTLALAGFCFILGAMGKSAQVPLHVWLPDAMEAPTTISALIHAATMVNAGVYLMARTLPLFQSVPFWTDTLMWIGIITAFLAATMALVEPDLKRVLAYSTVSQLGFMMFAIGLGFPGFLAAAFFLLSHAIFKALLFLGAGSVIHTIGTRDMYEMGGLRSSMKLTYYTMLIGGLALAGLIPLAGFWSKDYVFLVAYETGRYIPLIIMIIVAMFTAAYTFRMLNLVFWGKPAKERHIHPTPWQMGLPLVILAIGTLVGWMAIGYLSRSTVAFAFAEAVGFSLVGFIVETFTKPAIIFSLVALGLGVGLFYVRKGYASSAVGRGTIKAARFGYGFDAFYGSLVRGLVRFGKGFRRSHTGDLNYNLIGLVIGLAILVVYLFFAVGGI